MSLEYLKERILASTNDKDELRRRMRTLLASIDPDQAVVSARRACDNLAGLDCWIHSRHILLTLSFGGELDTDGVIRSARNRGLDIWAPVIEDRSMLFRRLDPENPATLKAGTFGIREPSPDAELWSAGRRDGGVLVLVPGLAFDLVGGRLGRGGGYFDRLIRDLRLSVTDRRTDAPVYIVGWAFDEQIVERVPEDSHDQRMDALVTDSRVWWNRVSFSLP